MVKKLKKGTRLKLKSKEELLKLIRSKKKKQKVRVKKSSKKVNISKLAKELIKRPLPKKRIPIKRPPLPRQPQVMLNLDSSAVYRRYLVEKEKALIRKKMQEMELSQNTQAELAKLAQIQNKSKTDDYKRQRIRREQEIVGKSMSILNTPYIFKGETLNPTGVQEDNILLAPNTFKEREDNPHILKQQRPSILQTRETGNQLDF